MICIERLFIPFFLHRVFFLKHSHPSISTKYLLITSIKDQGSSCRKGKEIASDNPTAKIMGKDATVLNRSTPRMRKGVATLIMSALPSLNHGTMLTPIFRWYPVTTCLRHRVVCGFPFAAMTWRCPGPLWLLRSLILIHAKVLHSLCPFSLSLDQVLLWVGRSG